MKPAKQEKKMINLHEDSNSFRAKQNFSNVAHLAAEVLFRRNDIGKRVINLLKDTKAFVRGMPPETFRTDIAFWKRVIKGLHTRRLSIAEIQIIEACIQTFDAIQSNDGKQISVRLHKAAINIAWL